MKPQISKHELKILSLYLDEQLSLAERKRVEERLRGNQALSLTLEELRQTRLALRKMPRARVPRNFTLTPAMVARAETLLRYPQVRRALEKLGGRVCADVGASTGGFTETLLERGAARVYAVDVGRGQLHEKLRQDPRVVVRDRVNARALSAQVVPVPCSLAVVDVSFISVRKVLPALLSVLDPGARAVVLVKPQFEVGRFQVGRGGLVKDPALHLQAVRDVAAAAQRIGYALRGACASPLPGAEGNREFFLHLEPGGATPAAEALDDLLGKAVSA